MASGASNFRKTNVCLCINEECILCGVYCFWCAIHSTFQFSTFYDLLNWIIVYLFYICTFKLKIARLLSSSLFFCIQKGSQMVWNSFCVEMWAMKRCVLLFFNLISTKRKTTFWVINKHTPKRKKILKIQSHKIPSELFQNLSLPKMGLPKWKKASKRFLVDKMNNFLKKLKMKMETNTSETYTEKKSITVKLIFYKYLACISPYGILMCRVWISSPRFYHLLLSPDTVISCYRLHTLYQHVCDNNAAFCVCYAEYSTFSDNFALLLWTVFKYRINSIEIIGGGLEKWKKNI